MTNYTKNNLSILPKAEINRKLLHFLFAIIPVSLFYLNNRLALIIIILLSFFTLLTDFLLRYALPRSKLHKLIYRDKELNGEKKLSGAFWIAISCLIVVLIFDKIAYIPAMLAISFCDSFSALIGKKYGKHKISFTTNKSWEGFFGFLIGGIPIYIIIIFIGLEISLSLFLIALIFAAFCELMEWIDDNLSIMIGFATIIQVGLSYNYL